MASISLTVERKRNTKEEEETPRRREEEKKKIQPEKKKNPPCQKKKKIIQSVVNGSHMKETKFWDDLEELIESKKGEFV